VRTTVNKISQTQIELKIEVPPEEFQIFVKKAVLSLGQNLEVKGFRKGKAPKEVIEKEVSPENILKEAAEMAIQTNYPKAINQLADKIKIISQPEIEILKLAPNNPLEFKAKIWILPEIKLPDYKSLTSRVQKKEVKVTEEEIEKLRQEKERWEKERMRREILEKIALESKVDIPEILIEEEKKRMLQSLKSGVVQTLQISFEDYLAKLQKTEKEILDSFLPESKTRIKKSLVLREIGKKENISVTEKEIEEEIKKISVANPGLETNLDPERLKDYTKEALINEKTFQFLEGFIKK